MAGKQQSKLHHFVPQGYLRGFANAKEQVKVVPLEPSRTPFTTAVRNVAAQNNFHTTQEFEEEPDWSVPEKMEAWFSCREFVDVPVS